MSDMTASVEAVEEVQPVELSADLLDDQLIGQLVDRARASGLQLTGEGGLLQQLTKRVLESALEGEITDHLGYDKHDPAGAGSGNSRNGVRAKTVLTDALRQTMDNRISGLKAMVAHHPLVADLAREVPLGAVVLDDLDDRGPISDVWVPLSSDKPRRGLTWPVTRYRHRATGPRSPHIRRIRRTLRTQRAGPCAEGPHTRSTQRRLPR